MRSRYDKDSNTHIHMFISFPNLFSNLYRHYVFQKKNHWLCWVLIDVRSTVTWRLTDFSAINLMHQVIPISFSVILESVAEYCVIQRKTVSNTWYIGKRFVFINSRAEIRKLFWSVYICHWSMRIHAKSRSIRALIRSMWDDTFDWTMLTRPEKKHQIEEDMFDIWNYILHRSARR